MPSSFRDGFLIDDIERQAKKAFLQMADTDDAFQILAQLSHFYGVVEYLRRLPRLRAPLTICEFCFASGPTSANIFSYQRRFAVLARYTQVRTARSVLCCRRSP
ncbi:MAG: hypothetical protein IPK44_02300 [Candidatus Accumulibacter sp.]|nr:hypothetical protein [Accumulibacter sp.]